MRQYLRKLQRTSLIAVLAVVVAAVVAFSTVTYASCGCRGNLGNCEDLHNVNNCVTGGTTICQGTVRLTCEIPSGAICAQWIYHGPC